MDLRTYYQRIRAMAASLPDPVVVASLATPDGGRAGRLTEVPRDVAARLIADGAAEIAGEAQVAEFLEETRQRLTEEETRRAAARIQVNVITEGQARALRPKNQRS